MSSPRSATTETTGLRASTIWPSASYAAVDGCNRRPAVVLAHGGRRRPIAPWHAVNRSGELTATTITPPRFPRRPGAAPAPPRNSGHRSAAAEIGSSRGVRGPMPRVPCRIPPTRGDLPVLQSVCGKGKTISAIPDSRRWRSWRICILEQGSGCRGVSVAMKASLVSRRTPLNAHRVRFSVVGPQGDSQSRFTSSALRRG